MAEGLDDDEETQFLRDNADLIPLCLVDVAGIADEYLLPSLGVGSVSMVPRSAWLSTEEYDPEDDLSTVISKEREFEAQLSRISRVKEDVLETVFLGEEKDSQPVKVSTVLGPTFCKALCTLL